jgi:hypothetical protein
VTPGCALTRARSDTTPKSNTRADISASTGRPSISIGSVPSPTVTGGFGIWMVCASPRDGRRRSGPLEASRSDARSSAMA